MTERCLQDQTGSCSGCSVRETARERIRVEGKTRAQEIVGRIQSELCPEGMEMQMPELQKQAVW